MENPAATRIAFQDFLCSCRAGIHASSRVWPAPRRWAQLSVALVAVISQVLMPKADNRGRVAGFEVMINVPAIGNLIRKNEPQKIPSTIQTSRRLGMITLDDYLFDLVKKGSITGRVALDYAQEPRDLEARL